jgi:hypothetical protein
MNARHIIAALTAAAAIGTPILLTSCGAGQPATAPPAHMMTMPNGQTMPMADMPGMSASAAPATDGPSESAQMICSPEIRNDVTTALGLPGPPPSNTTYANHLYTCIYHLADGPLVLSVKDLPSTAAADGFLNQLHDQIGPSTPLTGMDGLGNPGYRSTSGILVVRKDAKTLEVDPTGLPAMIDQQRARGDLAYEIGTDVLGCWSGQ